MLHIKDNRASDGGTVKHAIKKNISLTFFWLELTVCIISHREWSWTEGDLLFMRTIRPNFDFVCSLSQPLTCSTSAFVPCNDSPVIMASNWVHTKCTEKPLLTQGYKKCHRWSLITSCAVQYSSWTLISPCQHWCQREMFLCCAMKH